MTSSPSASNEWAIAKNQSGSVDGTLGDDDDDDDDDNNNNNNRHINEQVRSSVVDLYILPSPHHSLTISKLASIKQQCRTAQTRHRPAQPSDSSAKHSTSRSSAQRRTASSWR